MFPRLLLNDEIVKVGGGISVGLQLNKNEKNSTESSIEKMILTNSLGFKTQK